MRYLAAGLIAAWVVNEAFAWVPDPALEEVVKASLFLRARRRASGVIVALALALAIWVLLA